VYNEQHAIMPFITRIRAVFAQHHYCYELIFVLDPSQDETRHTILKAQEQCAEVKLVEMSRRFGQPAATIAGINYARGNVGVVIDVDLQDPPELIPEMIALWQQGADVVYGQRRTREGETVIKKVVSYLGYWLINTITNIKIPRNTGDFRLLDRKVIDILKTISDQDGFLRGLVAYVGFKAVPLLYDRDPRHQGDGHYNRYIGSMRIGLNGIIGFSRHPLHLISVCGLFFSLISFTVALMYFIMKIAGITILWGNPTLVILFTFFGGIQLLSLGIVGQYLARIYDKVMNRPMYIVADTHGFAGELGENR
jgi:dolichol-phosphate mannosyltransferase